MPSTNIESDPLFVLLTDALRAGPGSPQWQEALAALPSNGTGGADEHRLLLEARENLEKGREYRDVRAGPGFTRKLMGEIENDAPSGIRRGLPTATLVAILCGLVVLSAAGYLIHRLASRPVSLEQEIEDLQTNSDRFVDTLAMANFAGAVTEGWKPIGALPIDAVDGLHPANAAADNAGKSLGGGVVREEPIAAATAFAVDVNLRVGPSSGSTLLEIFVSTDPNFSADKGTSSRDIVWQLGGTNQQVLLSGSGQHIATPQPMAGGDSVRLIVDQNVAIVETVSANGGKSQRLWAGPHDLGPGGRYVGVRFLQTGAAGKDDISVRQIKITTPPG